MHLSTIPLLPLVPLPTHAAPSRSVLNSVLSAYGLPVLPDVSGFSPLLEQYDTLLVEFQYPTAWIIQRNLLPVTDSFGLQQAGGSSFRGPVNAPMEGRASGLTVGDYRKAEGLSFYVQPLPQGITTVTGVDASFIADLVTPGDATGSTPNARVVKDWVDDEGYRWVETKYESVTVSGYTVGRKARTRATALKDGKLYALTGSCTDIRWKKVGSVLDTSLNSFHVYRL